MIGWEVRILADNEQQDDYLSNMLNALNEKEQESQSYNDPETIARQAKEKLEAENAVKEANEPEREADADAKLEALLDNTPLEEAAGAKLTSDDNSELSDDDMKRLMNMNLDDIIDDVKSDSASIDDLFGSSPDKETEHNGKSADTQAQTISALMPGRSPIEGTDIYTVGSTFRNLHFCRSILYRNSHTVSHQIRRSHKIHKLLVYYPTTLIREILRL